MPSDVSVVVADPTRMPAIRSGMLLTGRAYHFTTADLAGAVDCARSREARLVAVDALWAQSPLGVSFIERIEKLAIAGSEIRLIARLEGRWTTMARDPIPDVAKPTAPLPNAGPAPPLVSAPPRTVVAVQLAVASTRRAPRFVVRDSVSAVVESGSATLVDMSVLGAQVVSAPVLRPNQKIKVALPDTGDMLHVMAHVKWSTFEQPSAAAAHYRAGLEFADAAQQTLEDYRLRHCAAEPIPYRSR
jgi:PilZ domain